MERIKPALQKSKLSIVKRLTALIFALLPIVAFYAMLFREMRSVPMFDDYQAVVSFVLIFKQLPSLGSKLLFIIAAQHDEYKLIFEHAIIAAQYSLTGHISFGFLILLGNLLVLGIAWLLWKNYFSDEKDLTRRIILFLPICYLLFQLNYVENLDWAMCSLQTIPVLFFTLASLHLLLSDKKWAFPLACLCAWLGCLSSSNAFLIAPIGLFILVPRRNWRQISAWTVTFFVALGMYLYRYIRITRPNFDPHVFLYHKIGFYFSFLGSSVENMHHFPIRNGSVVLGVLMIAIFCHSILTGFYRKNPFAFYSTLWVLITAILVAQVRSGLGLDMSLAVRYKIYSDLVLIFCYAYVVARIDTVSTPLGRKHLLYCSSLALIVMLAASSDYFGYKFLVKRQMRVEEGLNEYLASPSTNPPMISTTGEPILSGEPAFARTVLTQAIKRGIYIMPSDR